MFWPLKSFKYTLNRSCSLSSKDYLTVLGNVSQQPFCVFFLSTSEVVMIRLLVLSALLGFLGSFPVISAQDDYCFGKDTERLQTRHFGTLTAYQIVKGTNAEKQYLVPNCRPEKIWILHKHGTRLPSKYTIEQSTRLEEVSTRSLFHHSIF